MRSFSQNSISNSILAIGFTLILGAHTALAAPPNCAGLMVVLDRVTSCPKNSVLLDASVQCLNEFESRVRQAQAELAKTLVAPISHKQDANKVGRQTQSFGFNSSNQKLSAEKLAQLISYGKASREEINQYMRNLVIAFTTQGQSPDIDEPGAIEELSEDECYGDPRKQIEKVLARLDQDLVELAQTKASSEGLKSASDRREGLLGPGEYGGAKANAYRARWGSPGNGHSDVTGLKEDEHKRESAEAADFSKGVRRPGDKDASANDKAAYSAAKSSSISEQERNPGPDERMQRLRNPGLGSNLDPSGRFSNRGSLAAGEERARTLNSATNDASGKSSDSSSLGSVIWDGNPSSSNLTLGLNTRDRSPASDTLPGSDGEEISQAGSSAKEENSSIGATSVSLFERVSARYRKLELFREP